MTTTKLRSPISEPFLAKLQQSMKDRKEYAQMIDQVQGLTEYRMRSQGQVLEARKMTEV